MVNLSRQQLSILGQLMMFFAFAQGLSATLPPQAILASEEALITNGEVGRFGGRLTVALRTEPRTFNPVLATDSSSREVIGRLMADLVHINRETQKTESALAKTWKGSPDGKSYTLRLRRGLCFSDGQPLSADDVLFTFQVYLDEKVHSPQRDLLVIGGVPLRVRKVDALTLIFELAQPYAAAERLFDSLAILPRHKLQKLYEEGRFAEAWGLSAQPEQLAGLGPYRLKEYVPGQRIVLDRNPYYWKADRQKRRLPYLDEIVFLVVPSEDAQVIRFQAGETDLITRLNARNFNALARDPRAAGHRLLDLGPGLEYNFLFFNLNDLAAKNLPRVARKQAWFREVRFRQAVSLAIDRVGITRLVYEGRATPLWSHVTPGNRLWVHPGLARTAQSVDQARQLLRDAGFSWNSSGQLLDREGTQVEFTIVVSSSNAQRSQMATIIQSDLKALGMAINLVPIEFRSLLDRVFTTLEYEAAISGLVSGDADPTAEMNVWSLRGATRLWNVTPQHEAGPWEAEIDRLMQLQLVTLRYPRRKRLYDEVQQLVAENLPLICLASPNVLVAANNKIGNLRPAILEPYALWNVEELFFIGPETGAKR